jgi:hypothetical protein
MRPRLATSLSILAVAFVIFSVPALAQEDTPPPTTPPAVALPPWMTVEIVKAAVDIQMSDAQQHQFNDAVGEFVTAHFAMIQKELRKEAPDLEQRVKSRDGVLVRQMDTRLQPVLTTEQWPAYENYKKTLRAQLREMPLPQGSGSTRTPHGVGGGMG